MTRSLRFFSALLLTFLCVLPWTAYPYRAPAAAPPLTKPLSKSEEAALQLDQQILEESKKRSETIPNLTYLCDTIGPRLTGSASLTRAGRWTADKMKSYGLDNVRLEPFIIPEGWERGPASARIVEPENGRVLTIASYGWYPGTKGKVIGDVVILRAQSQKELAEYKGKLKGAIVLTAPPVKLLPVETLLKPDGPLSRAYVPEGFGGKLSFGEMRTYLRSRSEFLVKEGAAAILLDAGKPFGLVITTGGFSGTERPSALNRLPTLSIAHNHYQLLYRLASRPAPTTTKLELEVNNTFVPGPVTVYNVVGEIRGSEKPDEFVVLGAHLDSWDLGQGTTDNGTGSVAVLEAARTLSTLSKSGIKPKRTIRFVLFGGEEQGLHGSRAYVRQHKAEMPKTSVCLVHDTGTGRVKGLGCGGFPKIQAIFDRELEGLRALGVTDFRTRSGGGSDHQSFQAEGVPGFMMIQETAGYPFTHHTQADTLDRVRQEDLLQGAQVLALTAMRVANLDQLLPRERSK